MALRCVETVTNNENGSQIAAGEQVMIVSKCCLCNGLIGGRSGALIKYLVQAFQQLVSPQVVAFFV